MGNTRDKLLAYPIIFAQFLPRPQTVLTQSDVPKWLFFCKHFTLILVSGFRTAKNQSVRNVLLCAMGDIPYFFLYSELKKDGVL